MSFEQLHGHTAEFTQPKGVEQKILDEINLIGIKPEDRNAEGKLLVYPEGPVSNLAEEEWKIVRTKAFKEWFGQSLVTDENGEPLVAYHGSSKKFNKFDLSKTGANSGENKDSGFFGTGFYFTAHEPLAQKYGPILYKSFLRINHLQLFTEDHGNVRFFNEDSLPDNIKEEVVTRYKPLKDKEHQRLKEEDEKHQGTWGYVPTWNGEGEFEYILSGLVREILLEKGFEGVLGYNPISKRYEYTVFNSEDILIIHQKETG